MKKILHPQPESTLSYSEEVEYNYRWDCLVTLQASINQASCTFPCNMLSRFVSRYSIQTLVGLVAGCGGSPITQYLIIDDVYLFLNDHTPLHITPLNKGILSQ